MAVWRWLCKPWAEMSHLNFATVGHIFEALPGAQIMHMISRFKAWEVKSPEFQMVHNLELKRRSYGGLKTSVQSWAGISQLRRHLEGCFAAAKPLLAHKCHFAAQFPSFWSCDTPAKSLLSCEMSCEINFGLQNHFWALKWLQNDLQTSKWLRNHLQASKRTSNSKIDLRNGGRFAKTPCKAKGSC